MRKKYQNIVEFMVKVLPESNHKTKIAIMGGIFSGFDGIGRVMEMQAKDLYPENEITIFSLEGNLKAPDGTELQLMGAPANLWLNRIYRLVLPLNISLIWKYSSKLSEYDYIIVHQYPLSFLAWVSRIKNGNKYIYWHHHTSEGYPNFFHRIYMGLIEYLDEKSFLVKKADYVCSISEYSCKQLKSKSGIDGLVVYNSIPPIFKKNNLSSPEVKKIRKELEINNEQIILFVGRIHPTKNIHTLIRVFETVKKEIKDLKLIIVGKVLFPQYFHELLELRAALKITDSVIFTGYVGDEKLPYFYAACDVYATCSESEGFNLPLMEAQNTGKTVVAFDIPAHREVIRNGLLVEKGDIGKFAATLIKVLRNEK